MARYLADVNASTLEISVHFIVRGIVVLNVPMEKCGKK
jgi:hypothetical protein